MYLILKIKIVYWNKVRIRFTFLRDLTPVIIAREYCHVKYRIIFLPLDTQGSTDLVGRNLRKYGEAEDVNDPRANGRIKKIRRDKSGKGEEIDGGEVRKKRKRKREDMSVERGKKIAEKRGWTNNESGWLGWLVKEDESERVMNEIDKTRWRRIYCRRIPQPSSTIMSS